MGKKELYPTDASLCLYMTCYYFLNIVDDSRAAALLDSANVQLRVRAQTLDDTQGERSLFWSVSPYQAVLTAMDEISATFSA